MTTPEPNNAEAIRRSLVLLDQFEDSAGDIVMDDWAWRGVERCIEDLRRMLESDLKKLEAEMLYVFTKPA